MHTLSKPFVPTLLAGALLSALGGAQVASAAPVDAGSLLRQVQQNDDGKLSRPEALPQVLIQRDDRAELADKTPFALKSLLLSGNQHITDAELLALADGMTGRDVTLTQLGELAQRMTALYRSRGYPLARALVPAQTIRDGIVRIDVYEAAVGQVKLDNTSTVSDEAVLRQAANMAAGSAITDPGLERALLLVSDLEGIRYEAVLTPGERVGTSDLNLKVVPGKSHDASVGLDNFGNASTGRVRVNGALALYNPLGRGDVLNLNVMTSGSNMSYWRASHEDLLPWAGARWGLAGSQLNYRLGGAQANLLGHGKAGQTSAWVRYAIDRSVARSTSLRLQFDHLSLNDDIDSAGVRNDRGVNAWTADLSGNLRDEQSVSWWTAALSVGQLGFGNASAQSSDAASARSEGQFGKVNVSANHLRSLGATNSVLLSVTAQWAQKNLDSSQKMQFGGSSVQRAYDTSAISGDAGYNVAVEYRDQLAATTYGRWQWSAFAETGMARSSIHPWSTSAPNSVHLNSAGLSLQLEAAGNWSAKALVAKSLGHTAGVSSLGHAARAWVEISRTF